MRAKEEFSPNGLTPQPPRDGAPKDLESPFLSEELYTGEDRSDWEPRLAALAAESPFERAFEQSSVLLVEPAEPKEQLVEENERPNAGGSLPGEAEAQDEPATSELDDSIERLTDDEEAPYAGEEGEDEAFPENAAPLDEELLDPGDGLTEPELEDERHSSEQDSQETDQEGPDFESEDEESNSPLSEEVPPPIPVVKQPILAPPRNSIPFAESPPSGSFWPIRTSKREGRLVSYKAMDNSIVGLRGRMFLADRTTTNERGERVPRWHVGVDLFANKGDVVVACEAGRIVNSHRFLKTRSGQRSWAILVEHSNAVVNYGEVRADSLSAHGLSKGSSVQGGQPIGFISDTSMLHFETYAKGTLSSHRWLKGQAPPRELLNPTKYLLFLQEHGAPQQSLAIEPVASDDIDVGSAVQKNRQYSEQLGWRDHYDDIVRALGFTDLTPGPELFAKAVARWQYEQNLAVDGVIGPNTWARLRSVIGLSSSAAARTASAVSSQASATVQPSPQSTGSATDRPALLDMPNRLGTLVFRRDGQPDFRYEFRPDDLLWTARLISGEAGARDDLENRAVISAMLNRFALFTHRVYPTFDSFLRAYSTPLQPVLTNRHVAQHYLNDPRFRRLGGTYPGTTIPRGQLQQHLDLQETPWDRLRLVARKLAVEALSGRLPDTGIGLATEFASTWLLYGRHVGPANRTEAGWLDYTQGFKRDKGWRWIGQQPNLDQKRNAFFVDPRAANLPADSVRVEAPA